ncbi:MAG: AMP-binding protein [Myxococcota bacterium]
MINELVHDTSYSLSEVDVGEDAVALFQLTSGSTGAAKAVRISHANLYSNAKDSSRAMNMDPKVDVIVSWLPLSHDMGMVGGMAIPMLLGVKIVMTSPIEFLRRPMVWAELIQNHRGTLTAAPNFAYAVMAKQLSRAEPGSFDLSSLRGAFNGAEPIEVDTVFAFNEAAAAFGVPRECMSSCYGSAENTMATSYGRLDRPLGVDIVDAHELEANGRAVPAEEGGSTRVLRLPLLGEPLPHSEVRIIDKNGVSLGERRVGTVQIRGESVSSGYLTEEGPLPLQGADGWSDTGDLGYFANGEIVICGRAKDVIIIAGRNIYPSDIERAAARVDGLRVGSVIASRVGKEQGYPAETFVVFVESKRAGDSGAEDEISKAVASAVSAEVGARPSVVRVLPPRSLPKTPSGKLRRTAALELL